VRATDFSFLQNVPDQLWGHLATFSACVLFWRWSGQDVKLTSPVSNAEVKNEFSYASASPVCIHDMDRENFTPCTSCSHWWPTFLTVPHCFFFWSSSFHSCAGHL